MVEREEDYFYGFRIRYNFYERFYSYFICEFFCVFRISNDITDNSALRSRTWWDGSIYRNYRRYFYIFSFFITALCWACFVVKRPRYHRSEEHTSELQSRFDLVCCLLLEKL